MTGNRGAAEAWRDDEITEKTVGAVNEVRRELGRGVLRSACKQCVCDELLLRRLNLSRHQLLSLLNLCGRALLVIHVGDRM